MTQYSTTMYKIISHPGYFFSRNKFFLNKKLCTTSSCRKMMYILHLVTCNISVHEFLWLHHCKFLVVLDFPSIKIQVCSSKVMSKFNTITDSIFDQYCFERLSNFLMIPFHGLTLKRCPHFWSLPLQLLSTWLRIACFIFNNLGMSTNSFPVVISLFILELSSSAKEKFTLEGFKSWFVTCTSGYGICSGLPFYFNFFGLILLSSKIIE